MLPAPDLCAPDPPWREPLLTAEAEAEQRPAEEPPSRFAPPAPVDVAGLESAELAWIGMVDEDGAPLLERSAAARLQSAKFRERLAATQELEPWDPTPSGEPQLDYGERVLVLLASLTTGWAKDANTAVATAGLRFAHVQLRVFLDRSFPGDVLSGRPATGVTASAGVRALVSIATAATTRLTDRKAGPCASDCLHVAVELHSLRFGLAIIEPLAAAAVAAPAPAAAAMLWLAEALGRWRPVVGSGQPSAAGFDDTAVPSAAIACCVAALRSPTAATRKAALTALVALDRHAPVLERLAAPEHTCSASTIATVRAELARYPPARVVFQRSPESVTTPHHPESRLAPGTEPTEDAATALHTTDTATIGDTRPALGDTRLLADDLSRWAAFSHRWRCAFRVRVRV